MDRLLWFLHVLNLNHASFYIIYILPLIISQYSYIYNSIVLYHLFICVKLPLPFHHADDRVETKPQDTFGGTSCSKHPGVFGSGDFWCFLSIHNAGRVALWHGDLKRTPINAFCHWCDLHLLSCKRKTGITSVH